MGMYTQIRGWLCVGSITTDTESKYLENLFNKTQDDYEQLEKTPRATTPIRNTYFIEGNNGACYVFIGTEFKNYDKDAEEWIKYLLSVFTWAEGRIDFQYEEDYDEEIGLGTCKCWKIAKGQIEEYQEKVWCKGYGLSRF